MSHGSGWLGRYELLYGVTEAETYNMLTSAEARDGMTRERRNKLVRAYVSNNFEHQVN